MKNRWWSWVQKNSGGSHDYLPDVGITVHVHIEAVSEFEAEAKALQIGIYYNGCDDDGPDCPCCGDRWSSPDGPYDEKPKAETYWNHWVELDHAFHYADGRLEVVAGKLNKPEVPSK